jgi:hypothetical protein
MPDPASQIIMRDVDRLPPKWRELVYEYGYTVVTTLRAAGLSLADADDALWMRRSAKQAEWLATDYVTAKTRKNYFPDVS